MVLQRHQRLGTELRNLWERTVFSVEACSSRSSPLTEIKFTSFRVSCSVGTYKNSQWGCAAHLNTLHQHVDRSEDSLKSRSHLVPLSTATICWVRKPATVEFHSAHARGLEEQIFALDWHKVDEFLAKLAFRSLRFLVAHRAQGQPSEVSLQGLVGARGGSQHHIVYCTQLCKPQWCKQLLQQPSNNGHMPWVANESMAYITIVSSLLFAFWKARSCIPDWEPHCCFLPRNVRENASFPAMLGRRLSPTLLTRQCLSR